MAPLCSSLRILAVLTMAMACHIPPSLSYSRPPARRTLSVPLAEDADEVTPQQVHISLVGADKIRVTWLTEGEAPSTVDYGTSSGVYPFSASGSASSYSYVLYSSGQIHDVVIGPLQPDTLYYYRCGSNAGRELSFKTPPAHLPIKFAVVGDLGQTGWTNSTLNHVSGSGYDVLILPGDLSYADTDQPLWDSYGRLVEPLASSRPWMVTEGNHEVEKIPMVESTPFKAYNARWRMPYDASGSKSNLYYSFDVAGGSVHVVMLGSYTGFGSSSDQYRWLVEDLAKVDRNRTWVVAVVHAPWYNTNKAHQGEGEDMMDAMEELLYAARVDVVFAGHVHAYERFTRVYDDGANGCGAVHITIGDGGNREGLAEDFQDPQPEISLFREASFGHGQLEILNSTHALWSWHRNDDDEEVVSDKVWLTSLSSNPACITK
ncbi:putative purple acid phosphatase 20 [Iris pallida]|uniref:Purple acid phosphatase n=1 Tax=Iris pallida TaxID=29817 RepID=A0AAX6FX98_IRIPA|nr:putative purple acid phosphatase 20 [Iris pallida]